MLREVRADMMHGTAQAGRSAKVAVEKVMNAMNADIEDFMMLISIGKRQQKGEM